MLRPRSLIFSLIVFVFLALRAAMVGKVPFKLLLPMAITFFLFLVFKLAFAGAVNSDCLRDKPIIRRHFPYSPTRDHERESGYEKHHQHHLSKLRLVEPSVQLPPKPSAGRQDRHSNHEQPQALPRDNPDAT